MLKTGKETYGDAQAGIQSIEFAGTILTALLQSDGLQRLSDIAKLANAPAAKIHRYLVSLARIGLVAQDTATGLYDLGPMALQLGIMGFSRFDALRFAARMLEQLVDQVGETAALSVWGEHGPKFVRLVEARHGHASTVPVTHICPMTWSATGFLYSAYEDPDRTLPLIRRELEQNKLLRRQKAPRSEAELEPIVKAVRAAGFATVSDGGGGGIAAICAPVFGVTGRLTMALTIFARAGRIDTSADSGVVRLAVNAAARLSETFGFPGTEQTAEAVLSGRGAARRKIPNLSKAGKVKA